MGPGYPNAPPHLIRGSMCAIDSGHKRERDAGAACVFHEKDHELTSPRLFIRLLRVSPLRLASLRLQRCCAAGLRLPNHEPAVRGSWVGRRTIRLTLPLDALLTMGQDALDVLLATGLARSISARTPTYTPGRLLLAGLLPLACLTLLVCWIHHVLPVGLR